jgi:hypothetical protein
MEITKMINLEELLEESGDLHDAVVLGVHLDLTNKSIQLDIDDLNVNYEGLPEYKGRMSGNVQLSGLNNISLEFEVALKTHNIFNFLIVKSDQEVQFEINFWPSGYIKGSYKHAKVEMAAL